MTLKIIPLSAIQWSDSFGRIGLNFDKLLLKSKETMELLYLAADPSSYAVTKYQ